jgi:hypothetical protein
MNFHTIRLVGMIMVVAVCSSIASYNTVSAQWFEKANACYERQAYDSAVYYYEKIASAGITNAGVFYNLGNTYFRLHKAGPAMLYLQKAHALSPSDKDIQANITFVQATLADRIQMPQQSFPIMVFKRLHNMLPLSVQLWTAGIGLLLLSLLFAAALFAPFNKRLWIMYIASFIILVTGTLGVSAGIKIYTNTTVHYAVVLSPSIEALNQPNGSTAIFTAHEGTTLQIRQQVGDWSLVSLPTGTAGWVKTSQLGQI